MEQGEGVKQKGFKNEGEQAAENDTMRSHTNCTWDNPRWKLVLFSFGQYEMGVGERRMETQLDSQDFSPPHHIGGQEHMASG